MENHKILQEHPLRHLGRCLTQNTEFLQVVQVAQARKKADPVQSSETEWDLDFSSLDLFSWLSEAAEPEPAGAASSTSAAPAASPAGLATQSQEAIEHFRLFRGLWRLLELQHLPRAMEALLQMVQYAGQQRYSLALLQREVESLLLEAESRSFAAPWVVCLAEKTSEVTDRQGVSSACSTTSTAGPGSADGADAGHFFSQETAGGSCSDSDLSLGLDGECLEAQADDALDPQDLHAWELQFLCVAAAEDLWRALRSQDLERAISVVLSLREEILQVPLSPCAAA
mmetsp:Transcript_20842/g.34324  ORF Transcript_20842/g.34324 Transcript_20842/m.34324 type:complete len:285 (-) Transcript_20842:46-900(-)